MKSCLIAYSGGVDSTFLLKVAKEVLGDKVLAVTAISPTYPQEEFNFAKKMTRLLGVRHKVINTAQLKDKNFSSNPITRCYFCKRELFSQLKILAKKDKLNFVIEASNFSDKKDFRPGNVAKKELGVRSPLQEAGFTKEDIRKISRVWGLPTWNKPALACLASRIPYGRRITL
ncbi:MAG: ATP-dependent sacrificial sulfur transferase LarE, partial [Candidatus Omnitrophica bacterium]|nr:ATP-dependent sacrificial sulfur transferase LarE [Candidatus Omnitrophota bacterium]